jgi:anti-sigma factor RsiW
MTPERCAAYAEQLVDLADGEWPVGAAAEVQAHLAACPMCQRRLRALQGSLSTMQAVWRAAERDLQALRAQEPPASPRSRRPVWRLWPVRAVAVAAIAAGLIIAILRVGQQPPAGFPPSGPNGGAVNATPAGDLALVERDVAEAGMASEMLASAEMLAAAPGGASYARSSFRFIAERYRHTSAGRAAKARLAEIQ